MADAIQFAETQGHDDCHLIPGRSKERGCFQFLDSTWRSYAKIVLGYVPPRTYTNERYVVVKMIDRWLRQGFSEAEIARLWNGGSTEIKRGVNQYGEPYDTEVYSHKVLTYLTKHYD